MWRIEAQGRQTAAVRENRQRRQSTSRDYSQPNPLGLFLFLFFLMQDMDLLFRSLQERMATPLP